ncbi:class II aldolase/adducin family protein [Caenimonas aquaedulcis]|uniref:Class II aldolase/adducin family protein n=1 Tax=Caenimonas aquaedulcis TaxID=2793270 RepID=A0A931H3L6_9BURK|nr:class II aldolase/adducin family protein [Caenimonas aquaedulcis]MBG9387981.1 class II aldolase/adducin family protein [Caenimonas aquaedulcis]
MNPAPDSLLRYPEVRDSVSREEWEQRVNLAAAFRLCAKYKMTDLIYAHLSAKVPGKPGQYLINAYGLFCDEVTASNLVTVNFDDKIVHDPTGLGVNPSGYVVHGGLHKRRPDVQCVIHVHTMAGGAVSAQAHGLLNLTQHAMRFHDRVAYSDFAGTATNDDEAERLGRDLGGRKVMILRNHGLLTCGSQVREAFDLMYHLESACQMQVGALAGGNVIVCDPATAESVAAYFDKPNRVGPTKDWPAMLRMLDRADPSFRD